MKKISNKKESNVTTVILIFAIVVLPFGLIFYLIFSGANQQPAQASHWHSPISYEICGEDYKFDEREAHGLLHGHEDNTIHVEGVIPGDESIKLKNFFKTIGVEFNESQIGPYKNGDLCPDGTPGKVKLLINGEENLEYGEWVIKDKANVKVIFY